MEYTLPLDEVGSSDVSVAGGKAAQLGELISFGMSVPAGFVLSTAAYDEFSGGDTTIEFEEEVLSAFDGLGAESVAVRSSATVEDSAEASWAGELETYLNVRRCGLLDAVEKCWSSIEAPRAQAYKKEKNISKKISVAVVVQEMVDAEVAGVCFTVHPVTKNRNQLIIEACFGLGEAVVAGLITPDNYVVDKNTMKVVETHVNTQNKKIVYADKGTKEVGLTWEEGSRRKLPDEKIVEIAGQCKKIEDHYSFPQDVEWAIKDEKIHILQTRPVTTLLSVA